MRLRDDDRAQSMQIGAIILFGFLIIAMATYQAQVVPTSNSATEFEHSQEVQGQFIDLRSAVLSAASTGNPESTSLSLGTRYPQRTLFINPPPATGTISTSDPRTLRIDNASVVADGENTQEFWSNTNTNLTFETKSIRYTPQYNEYDDPPELVYEHSLVAAEFDDAVLGRTGQTAVENGEISLTLIDGTLSQSGVGQRGIDPEVLSQNARRVTLEADSGGPIVLVLPTTVEGEEKREELASEWESEIEANASVTAMDGGIHIEIDAEEVDLRLAQVGLGTDTTRTDGAYITEGPKDDGGFVAEVRDRFNNPVEDAVVGAYSDREATNQIKNYTTDSEGRVSVSNSSVRTLAIDGGSERWEKLTIERETTTDPNDPIYGPTVTDESGGSTTVEQGDPFYPGISVDSVGTGGSLRSGTPIQGITYEVVGSGGTSITSGTYAEFDPDTSNRTLDANGILDTATAISAINTSGWEPGNYTARIQAQDASGRFTPDDEEAEVDLEVIEPTNGTTGKPPAEEMYNIHHEDWTGDRQYIFDITSDNVWEAEWSFGDGTTETNHYVQHTYDEPGTYTITLDVVYDGTEYTYTDTIEVQ